MSKEFEPPRTRRTQGIAVYVVVFLGELCVLCGKFAFVLRSKYFEPPRAQRTQSIAVYVVVFLGVLCVLCGEFHFGC